MIVAVSMSYAPGCSTTVEGSAEIADNVNFLNIRTPKKFVVIILKFEQRGFTIEKCVQKT